MKSGVSKEERMHYRKHLIKMLHILIEARGNKEN